MENHKKIGIIGGVTWLSTMDYYKLINQKINQRLGGYHTATILINSVNFNEVMVSLSNGNWDEIEELFETKAKELKKAGAQFIAISSNTIAKVANNVALNVELPLVSIIESTANEILKKDYKKVGFLGTGYTMKNTFYLDELAENSIEAIVPNSKEIETISSIIMTELAHNILNEDSKAIFLEIMNRMMKEYDLEGFILGCTEIPLLIKQSDTSIPLFDTTEIHTDYIVNYALKDSI